VLVLSLPLIRWFGENFVPRRTFEEKRDPDISPLYADLAGMPPALFRVGPMECLLAHSVQQSRIPLRGAKFGLRPGNRCLPEGGSKASLGTARPAALNRAVPPTTAQHRFRVNPYEHARRACRSQAHF